MHSPKTSRPAPTAMGNGPQKTDRHPGAIKQTDKPESPAAQASSKWRETYNVPDSDTTEGDFDWLEADREGLVLQHELHRLAVYENRHGNIVIREDGGLDPHGDTFIILGRDRAAEIALSLARSHTQQSVLTD